MRGKDLIYPELFWEHENEVVIIQWTMQAIDISQAIAWDKKQGQILMSYVKVFIIPNIDAAHKTWI